MKHFFPFLAALLLLCILLHTFPKIAVSAQQHNSFASAKQLSLDHSISITLPANASEYYYFLSLHSTNPASLNYQIVLSGSESLSVSVYDDQGNAINLKKTSSNGTSNWTTNSNSILDSERFFLVLHNQSKQDISLQLSVKSFLSPAATASPKSNSNVKKTATAEPGKRSSPSSTPKTTAAQKARSTPKRTSRPQTITSQKSQNASKYASSTKTTAAPNHQNVSKHTSCPNSKMAPKPQSTSGHTSQSEMGHSASITVTASPITTPALNNYQSISRSNSILSKHFCRMSVGYSISAFELLSIHASESGLTLQNVTPETISLQNNIIFAITPGLAVIQVHYNDITTSCTIYVQDTQ